MTWAVYLSVWPGALAGPTFEDRETWLAARRSFIGGSDVAPVLGLPEAFGSRWSVWLDKTTTGLASDEDNAYMEFGRRIEPVLATWYADRTGRHVAASQQVVIDPRSPHRGVTLDGAAWPSEGDWLHGSPPECLVEYKAAGFTPWSEIPIRYQAQGQYQMAVSGVPVVDFAVLHNRTFEVYRLEADPVDQAAILDAVDRFWTEHVLTRIPPEPDGHDATTAALRDFYCRDDGSVVTLPIELVDEWRTARAGIAVWKEREAALANQVRARMGSASLAIDPAGRKVATWSLERDLPAPDARLEGNRKRKPTPAERAAEVRVPERAAAHYQPTGTRVFRFKPQEDPS